VFLDSGKMECSIAYLATIFRREMGTTVKEIWRCSITAAIVGSGAGAGTAKAVAAIKAKTRADAILDIMKDVNEGCVKMDWRLVDE